MAVSQGANPHQDVVFYVLASDSSDALEAFVAKLVRKIYKEKRQCDIRLQDNEGCQRLDLVLWETPQESFMPHAVALELPAPIQLWNDHISESCEDVLLNLHPDFFTGFEGYQRTIEILDQSEALLQKGRERWKQYRSAGFEPVVHKIP